MTDEHIFSTLPPIPPSLPEKGIHDQGVPSNTHCSNYQGEEGNDVVNVVLDIHMPVKPTIQVHFYGNKHTNSWSSTSNMYGATNVKIRHYKEDFCLKLYDTSTMTGSAKTRYC